jgi:hypothetical protein
MEQEHAIAATAARLTVEEVGERLVTHLEALGRKKSTVEGYRSALNVHLCQARLTSNHPPTKRRSPLT